MRICTKCGKKKIANSRFSVDGRCRSCFEKDLRASNPEFAERQRKNCREWHDKNPDKVKVQHWTYHIKRTYNLTPDEYFTMLENQGGGCKLCGRRPNGKNKLPIDHNHKTGAVRGILCTPCNRALGILEDNMEKVLEYLK